MKYVALLVVSCIGAAPLGAVMDAEQAHEQTQAVKPTVEHQELSTLMRDVSEKVDHAAKSGKSDIEVDTKGYSLHTVRETMKALDRKHYYVDYYLPHSLYVKWS